MLSFNASFPNLVSEPGLLGPPVKHDGSFIDRDYDMKKGLLNMRHVPDIRGQSSAEPPLIPRPPVPAYGSWLVEDDISNRTQTNSWPFASPKESNVVKSEKHQTQPKQFSHKTEVPVLKMLFICRQLRYLIFGGRIFQLSLIYQV